MNKFEDSQTLETVLTALTILNDLKQWTQILEESDITSDYDSDEYRHKKERLKEINDWHLRRMKKLALDIYGTIISRASSED